MAGTVTGRNSKVWIAAHTAGGAPTWTSKTHSTFGLGDFSLTLSRDTVEQNLIGQRGNYFDQGSLSIEGSLTSCKFATVGLNDVLDNMIDNDARSYQYLAISGTVSTDTDATYISWYLMSCQATGYDVSIGNADTVSEAAIDFTHLLPQAVTYKDGCITDA
jgi:hypothetical protein